MTIKRKYHDCNAVVSIKLTANNCVKLSSKKPCTERQNFIHHNWANKQKIHISRDINGRLPESSTLFGVRLFSGCCALPYIPHLQLLLAPHGVKYPSWKAWKQWIRWQH